MNLIKTEVIRGRRSEHIREPLTHNVALSMTSKAHVFILFIRY